MSMGVNKLRIKITEALLYMIRQKDLNLYEHSINVFTISTNIAKVMVLTKEKIFTIRLAALLHDVGKILIPSEILNKPTKLTNLEYSIIKKHVHFSYKILGKYGIFERISIITLRHHEKYGYDCKN